MNNRRCPPRRCVGLEFYSATSSRFAEILATAEQDPHSSAAAERGKILLPLPPGGTGGYAGWGEGEFGCGFAA